MGIAPDTNEQDEALKKRHEERERIAHAETQSIETGEVPIGSVQRERIESKEVVVTSWRFPGMEKKVQLTVQRDKVEYYGNGYMVLSIEGARELHARLGSILSII